MTPTDSKDTAVDEPEEHAHEALYWRWKRAEPGPDQELLATELSRALMKYAHRIVFELTGRDHNDLCVDIVSHAFLHEGEFKASSKFTTWFFSLARNRALNFLRDRRRKREWSLESSIPEETASPSRMTQLAETSAELASILRSVTPEDAALLKGLLLGLSYKQLAQQLGLDWRGVEKRWRQLKKRLREQRAAK
jgi:RNA polymerase sigma factor (sigma-70 family)